MNSFKEIKADIKQLQDDIKEMKDGFTPAISQNASGSLINNLLKLEKEHFETLCLSMNDLLKISYLNEILVQR